MTYFSKGYLLKYINPNLLRSVSKCTLLVFCWLHLKNVGTHLDRPRGKILMNLDNGDWDVSGLIERPMCFDTSRYRCFN